ncbi:uncharacterized protein LOC133844406 [Drosophila sulfurigaster albostrigata]|uniref:uncharacterized protein LOC133844406 n=1 Tax=Drosophila sulfurigaster albostrigata TaxID=89887 RepID=UPI002D21AB16|nr:uncharacterized protein LOC133844406 [Drosophila sulfurigaster albostrigata]
MKLDNYRLIVEVGRRRALWDSTMQLSQRKDVGNMQWDEVASIMGTDVSTCKKRFKGLRDSYRAEVRKIQRRSIDHSNWPYFRPLEFLRNIFDPDQMVPFAPLPFNIDSDCNESADLQKLDDFVIDVDNDDSFDFEIMGDIFKRETSDATGADSGSDMSLVAKHNNYDMSTALSHNRSDMHTSPGLLSPLPKAPTAKRKRYRRNSADAYRCANGRAMSPAPAPVQKSTSAVAAAADVAKDDADHNFLVSLLPHMKTLSTLNNMKFRTEVSRLLMELNQQDMQRETIQQSSPSLPKLTPAPASTNHGYHQQANSKYNGTNTQTNGSIYAAQCSIIECDVKIENEPLF